MYAVRLAALAAFAVAALVPAASRAAVVITPGADTVSTPRLELDFGNAGADVERLDFVRWRDGGGTLGSNLAPSGGTGGCDGAFAPEFWGKAGAITGPPQPVGDGSQGGWVARGGRTVEITSFRPTLCTSDGLVNPVRTRYTFFNVGDAASKVRVERRISFGTDYAAASIRPYVPRMPINPYSTVVQPNAGGTLTTESAGNLSGTPNWNGTWYAIENPTTRAGVLVLRESGGTAQLQLEEDVTSNTSAIAIAKPGTWAQTVTDAQWLCFYDQSSWPLGSRSATSLPSGCSIVTVPINTAAPAIVAEPRVGVALTATDGTWDNAASLTIQWLRCAPGCTAIPGATSETYTPGLADEGNALRVDVTAAAADGEVDVASSGLTGAVQPGVPQNITLPKITGEARDDEPLRADPGTWGDSPTSFQYQWRRCASSVPTTCADVPGATGTTYLATKDDVGARMRVRVIGVNALGPSLPADSAPTAEVQRLVVKAVLSISPSPTCTGVRTAFDGSGSKTPNGPITRYRFTYKVIPVPVLIGAVFAGVFGGDVDAIIRAYLKNVPPTDIADGPSGTASQTFTWTRQLTKPEVNVGRVGDYARDPVAVTLQVTDKAGATSTFDFSLLEFSQFYSSQSRKNCPRVRRATSLVDLAKVKAAVGGSTAKLKVPCGTKVDCAGSFTLLRAKSVLATSRLFSVRGKRSATVNAPLTAAGRALAKRGKPFLATLKLTTVNPTTGKSSVKSKSLTLKP